MDDQHDGEPNKGGRPRIITTTDFAVPLTHIKVSVPEPTRRLLNVLAADMATSRADVICVALTALQRARAAG